jgi:hypothetical protein
MLLKQQPHLSINQVARQQSRAAFPLTYTTTTTSSHTSVRSLPRQIGARSQ